ncbi:MAG: glutamate--tRNA ligase [Candidatus Omnitrophota bacterium]|jgi:glutamyl-tRNA synthetase|nr:MAG: glutamate--tRNA ligase [Candidatus Omnitrophota bacterium]
MTNKKYNSKCRVRFAPSPTGNPHVGNFRTALYNYLFARHAEGEFLLRIEDTDKERSRKEYETAILQSLAWMGLQWDGDPYYQSAHVERHRSEAQRLLAEGKAYRCRCRPEELEERRKAQMEAGRNPMYDGRCRDQNHPDGGEPFCVRLKTPREGITTIRDPIRGDIAISNEEMDDLIILRTDGTPTYNFAVVVDDYDMGITHVIRGDDHLNNTARQVLIYRLLDYPLPAFAHLPQILGQDRSRLSKRHGATGVLEYREQGYLPEALINYLAKLGWGYGDQEFFTREELIRLFTLETINKSAAVFDPQKLIWLNGEHIRALDAETLTDRFIEYVQFRGYLSESFCNDPDRRPLFRKIVSCTQIRAKTLDEIYEKVSFLFSDELVFPQDESRKWFQPEVMAAVQDLADFAAENRQSPPSHEAWEAAFGAVLETHKLKMKVLAQAVRLALTGAAITPPIFDVIDMLGIEQVEQRLRRAVEFAKTI